MNRGEQYKLEAGPSAFPTSRRQDTGVDPSLNIHILESMQRHPMLALAVFLITVALGFTYLHVRYASSYLAEAIIYVSPTYPRTLDTAAVQEVNHEAEYSSYVDQQVHSVTRPDILVSAIRKMQPGIWRMRGESEQSAAQRLGSALEVQRVAETFEVSIGLHGAKPEHLAEIVNAVAQAYTEAAHDEEFFGRDSRLQGLRDQREQTQTTLNERLAEQAALLKDLGLGSINSSTVNPFNERLAQLQHDLLGAREQRLTAESQLNSLNSAVIPSEAAEMAQSDQGLNALKVTLNQRRGKLLSDMAGMTPENPVYKQDQQEMADIDAALRRLTVDTSSEAQIRLDQKYRSQLNRANAFERDIESQIEHESAEAAAATPKYQAALEMNGDIDRMNARLNEIKDRIANLEIEESSPGSVHLFSPAQTPFAPDSSKAKTLLLVLFPLCFCLAIASAVARDTFDMRVFAAEDVERMTGIPPIGVLFNRDEVTDEVSSEYLFRIAASLDHARRTASIQTVAVTSVKPRGGTSTIVDLLAAELAQLGNRVLVLDAGGSREPVAFIPPEPDAATGNSRARTLHPELGPYLHSRGRLLPSVHSVTRSFRETHGDYDILLLDCQPLFISADTEYLARSADATLLIVESGMVLKQDLLRASKLLERLPVSSVAIVLNRMALSRADASLREDLRDFVSFGRGFAHGKPIPLTSTRHNDYPISTPEYTTYEHPAAPAHEPAPQAYEPSAPQHDSSIEDVPEDRSEGRNDE